MRRIVAVGLLWAWVVLGVVGGEGLVVEITTEGQLKEAIDPDYALAAVYAYDGKQKDASLSAKFQEVAKSLEGFLTFYMGECGAVKKLSPNASFCAEESNTERPLLMISRPPDIRINPYTNKPMPTQQAKLNRYQLGNMTAEQTVNMLVGMLPDYTSRLETGNVEQLQVAKFVNKVLLFTAKAQAPALFKALAAKYKNKLLFGYVESKERDLCNEYNVTKFPHIIVEQSINHTSGEIYARPRMQVYKGDTKIGLIDAFIKPYARNERYSDGEMHKLFQKAIDEEVTKVAVLNYVNDANVSTLLAYEEPLLLFVSKDTTIPPQVREIAEKLKLIFPSFFYHVGAQKTNDDVYALFQVKALEQFVYLPYGKVKKAEGSRTVKLSDHTIRDLEAAVPDRSVLLFNNTFDGFVNSAVRDERKLMAIYLGAEERVPLVYKVLATNEELRKDVAFTSFIDPPAKVLSIFGLKSNQLPRIAGLLPADPARGKNAELRLFAYPSQRFTYKELTTYFNSLIDLVQNRTSSTDAAGRRRRGRFDVVELNTTKDLHENCIDKAQLCFIAFLDAGTASNQLQQRLQQQLKLLRDIREKKEGSPLEIMWVNATCHTELLKPFGLDEMAIPTVVVYAPRKKMYGSMVGKFDMESVLGYIEGVLIGRTSGRGFEKIERPPEIRELKCAAIAPPADETLSAEEKKMLEEIIKEENRKKEELKKAAGINSNNAKKRPAKKRTDL